jgi:hypothetical protein
LDRGRYPGALSRTDNKTQICSDCGVAEALEDFFDNSLLPQSAWTNRLFQQLTVVEEFKRGGA